MDHTVTTHWKSGTLFESDNPTQNTVLMDMAAEKGGSGSGLSPKAMMLASLAGCSGLDVVSILEKMKVSLEGFTIVTTGQLTDEHPKYYHSVHISYQFKGQNLPKDKVQRAVDLSVDKYCGVMEMFRRFAAVSTEVLFEK